MSTPWAVRVVVPARDEEARLADCLDAVAAAVAHLHGRRPEVDVTVTVALDSCTDGSAAVAAGHRCEIVRLTAGRVGAARAAGVGRATRRDVDGSPVWVANTDADTVVPPTWLTTQLGHAEAGADLVLGSVEPAGLELDDATLTRWRARHVSADGHPHVHGANLGVALAAYRRAGGFPPLATHEDVALVDAVRRIGGTVVSIGAAARTSARRTGRTPGGFAGYLRDLDGEAVS